MQKQYVKEQYIMRMFTNLCLLFFYYKENVINFPYLEIFRCYISEKKSFFSFANIN